MMDETSFRFRAFTHITGFVLRSRHPESGCVLNYVAQCDPQGKLPPWLVNKVTHTLGPRMIKDIRKAALGYIQWKQNQSHIRKPWRFPEEITVPRILVSDCWDPIELPTETKEDSMVMNSMMMKKKKENKTISLPSTPTTTQYKSITSNFNSINNTTSNGNGNGMTSLPGSTTGSPLPQKKSKRKFKFKFDKSDK
jgi:hypothetical protein